MVYLVSLALSIARHTGDPVPASGVANEQIRMEPAARRQPAQADPSGARVDPSGARVDPSGTRVDPSGARVDPSGARVDPSGARVDPSGTRVDPSGTRIDPSATRTASGEPSIAAAGAADRARLMRQRPVENTARVRAFDARYGGPVVLYRAEAGGAAAEYQTGWELARALLVAWEGEDFAPAVETDPYVNEVVRDLIDTVQQPHTVRVVAESAATTLLRLFTAQGTYAVRWYLRDGAVMDAEYFPEPPLPLGGEAAPSGMP